MELSPKVIDQLTKIIEGPTAVSSAGFPIIGEEQFDSFLQNVPHLFFQGHTTLEWLKNFDFTNDSQQRAVKVLETVVGTAGVTAPPDLWLLRLLFHCHEKSGLLAAFREGGCRSDELCEQQGFLSNDLNWDLHFMLSRGLIDRVDDQLWVWQDRPWVQQILEENWVLRDGVTTFDWVEIMGEALQGREPESGFMQIPPFVYPDIFKQAENWTPGTREVHQGASLVPLVLAIRLTPQWSDMVEGTPLNSLFPNALPCISKFLNDVGFLKNGLVTSLGLRAIKRGPGPYGIIHAYYPYLEQRLALLQKDQSGSIWVSRGKNVAASKDANQKTFNKAIGSLKDFCRESGFKYNVFIEHAVGQGEGIRQHHQMFPEGNFQYFGADLEDAAIDSAIAQKEAGNLPANTLFIRDADIGKPQTLIEGVEKAGFSIKNAVMVVGNGYHEVRNQTNEGMTAVFKAYHDAGVLIIFTEESALNDEDLLNTGWNTYHAGFRYVHELSGQGLRPAHDGYKDPEMSRLSWKACVEAAGYRLHPTLTTHTRTIYPHARKGGYNPAISVNYFCVPQWG